MFDSYWIAAEAEDVLATGFFIECDFPEEATRWVLYGITKGDLPEIIEIFDNPKAAEEALKNRTQITPPSDPDGQNNDRAAWALCAIRAFMAETDTDYEDALSDLLCDFMHLCDREPFDFDAELARAKDHYLAETGQPGPITD